MIRTKKKYKYFDEHAQFCGVAEYILIVQIGDAHPSHGHLCDVVHDENLRAKIEDQVNSV